MTKKYFLILLIALSITKPQAQSLINTSFESTDNYISGSIHNQNKWTVTAGSGQIVTTAEYLKDGLQALKLSTAATALQIDHTSYASNATALSGDIYIDFWIKLKSLPTASFSITGYDLGTNTHRSFMLDFLTTGKIKIYDGSAGWATQPNYTVDSWTRISLKIDNGAGKYQLAINGTVYDKVFTFREIRNSATSFDFHAIRFSMSSGTCDVALENMYIGSTPLADISFQASSTERTVTINQPAYGTITLTPQQTNYYNGTSVSAQLNLQSGYQFNGWTGSLSGTTNPVTFIVNSAMTIGANVSEIQVTSTKRTVSTVAQFKDALATMNPGDTVLVLDGNYALGSVKINRGGSLLKPILIKSVNLHGAKITGSSAFTLSAISYVTFEGFDIDLEPMSTIFKMEGCNYVRITRNKMKMKKLSDTQTSKWITVGDTWDNEVCNSHHNRFDHNLFEGKYDSGAWLVIDGSHGTVPAISQHDRIDHNIFRNNTPRMANEKETVRIGVSDLCKLDAFTVVENNLFEDCDGDPEIVSVKSCKDTVRNNTFRRCVGTVCLRQGNNSVVEGNYFFGEGKTILFDTNPIGCGGVRVYGLNHKIFNNYFEGLTGSKWDAACTLTNGDVTNSSSSNSSHFLPENIIFANNTLINNKSDIEIGFNNNGEYGLAPKNNLIINNIITNNSNPIIKSFSTTSLNGVSFQNNIMFPNGTSTLGISGLTENQVKQVNPELIKTNCRVYNANCDFSTPFEVYKLSSVSPAINASNGTFAVIADIEGQPANGIRDIGADEFNANSHISNGPLNENHVGPTAPEDFQYESISANAIESTIINSFTVSPNPFTKQTTLSLTALPENKVCISLFNSLGQQFDYHEINTNNKFITLTITQKGLIFCKLKIANQVYSVKLISE